MSLSLKWVPYSFMSCQWVWSECLKLYIIESEVSALQLYVKSEVSTTQLYVIKFEVSALQLYVMSVSLKWVP